MIWKLAGPVGMGTERREAGTAVTRDVAGELLKQVLRHHVGVGGLEMQQPNRYETSELSTVATTMSSSFDAFFSSVASGWRDVHTGRANSIRWTLRCLATSDVSCARVMVGRRTTARPLENV